MMSWVSTQSRDIRELRDIETRIFFKSNSSSHDLTRADAYFGVKPYFFGRLLCVPTPRSKRKGGAGARADARAEDRGVPGRDELPGARVVALRPPGNVEPVAGGAHRGMAPGTAILD